MPRAKSAAAAKSSKSRTKSSSARKSASRTTRGSSRAPARRPRRNERANDAIALLKQDHRRVEDLFAKFEKARGGDRKRAIAEDICNALRVHTQIEEEIFYPAFYEATGEEDLHHEAIVEHDGAKKLIAEIESSGPEDELYSARVSVLSEMIRHHVNEEEMRDGMFAKAGRSEMDLAEIGEQLASRKRELESSPDTLKTISRAVDAGKGLLTRLTSG